MSSSDRTITPDVERFGYQRAGMTNGVPADRARLLAAGQRPFAVSAGSEPSGAPAGKSLPSWAVVGTADHVIPPAGQRAMAERSRPGPHLTAPLVIPAAIRR